MTDIRIERGEEIDGPQPNAGKRHGKWRWTCAEFFLEGFSRQPLLDACREIKRLGGDTARIARTFRKGSNVADMSCAVGIGANYTVIERDVGVLKFERYREFAGIEQN